MRKWLGQRFELAGPEELGQGKKPERSPDTDKNSQVRLSS